MSRPVAQPRFVASLKPRNASRWATVAAAAAALIGGFQLATPSPAHAIPGLVRTAGFSEDGTAPWKIARAYCPAGKRVVGGGAIVSDRGAKKVRLTSLTPLPRYSGAPDRFEVQAEAPYLSYVYSWKLAAYALCADSSALSRYELVQHWNDPSSATFQTAAARCPSGTVAYGAGASIGLAGFDDAGAPIGGSKGRVGLQLNRTSGPLDISRATAREDGEVTYTEPWTLYSSAICAEPRGAIHAEGQIAAGAEATDTCNSGFRIHGPGGGGGLTDGGPVWLQRIYPRVALDGVDVRLTGPLYPSIGGMVAHQTCAL